MIVIAHFVAISFYAAAAALAALPFARRVAAPVNGVIVALALGRMMHGIQARRAAVISTVTFASVIAMYVVFRAASLDRGQFL